MHDQATKVARGIALPRTAYAAVAAAAILAGLAVHLHGAAFGTTTRDVIGDMLWALMMAAILSVISPQTTLRIRGFSALCTCFAVEFSQLLHTPSLDQLRSTFVGHLVLGSGFDARDLFAYAGGIAVFAIVEHLWVSKLTRTTPHQMPEAP